MYLLSSPLPFSSVDRGKAYICICNVLQFFSSLEGFMLISSSSKDKRNKQHATAREKNHQGTDLIQR